MSEKQRQEETINAVTSNPKDMVPKLANKVAISKSSADNYILTFLFGTGKEETPILVERIVLDKNAMKGVLKILNDSQEEQASE